MNKTLNFCLSLFFLCSIAYASTGSATITVTSGSLSPLPFENPVEINKSEYCEEPGLNACSVSGLVVPGTGVAQSLISIVVGGVTLEAVFPTGTVNAASSYTSGETIFKAPFIYSDSKNPNGDFVSQGLITGTITSVGRTFSAAVGAHALFAIRAEVIDTATNEIVGGADIMGETCTTETVNDFDLVPSPCLNHFNNTIPVSFLASLRNGHEYQLQISSSCETRFSYAGAGAVLFPGAFNRIAQCTGQVEPNLDFTDPPVLTTAGRFSVYVAPDIEGYIADLMAKLGNLDTTVSSRASQESLNTIAAEIKARLEQQQTELLAKLNGIEGQVAQHDGDIKSQLEDLEANIRAQFEELKAKTDEVIRLVKTPEGQRRK